MRFSATWTQLQKKQEFPFIFDDSSSQDSHTDVTGSYVLLYRAVYNLVENAIKYNRPNGSVTVSVKEKNSQVMILVKDTGIGISPENQKKNLLILFFRVDKSRSRTFGGAGLGLALVWGDRSPSRRLCPGCRKLRQRNHHRCRAATLRQSCSRSQKRNALEI